MKSFRSFFWLLCLTLLQGLSHTATAADSNVAGDIGVPNEVDTYTFSLTNRQQFYFDALTGNNNFRWALVGPAGPENTANGALTNFSFFSDGYNLSYPVLDLSPGSYALRIYSINLSTGAYSFRLAPVELVAPIPLGGTVSGDLTPARETDLYQFNASAGDAVKFTWVSGTGTGNYVVRLLNPAGEGVYMSESAGSSSIITVPYSGRHLVAIEGSSSASGTPTYSFKVEILSNTPPATLTGTLIGLGTNVSGTLASGQTNRYRIDSTSTNWVVFDSLTNQNSSFIWTLLHQGGRPVDQRGFDQDGGNIYREIVELRPGVYELDVVNLGGMADFAFKLVDLTGAPSVPVGVSTNFILDPARSTVAARVPVPAGMAVTFGFPTVTQGGNAYLRLFTTSTNEIQSRYIYGSDSVPVGPFPSDVTVLMEIAGFAGTSGTNAISFVAYTNSVLSTPLALGSVQTNNFQALGQKHEYTFNLPSARPVKFDVLSPGTNGVQWRLTRGPVVVFDSSYLYNDDRFLVLEAGDYKLTLSPGNVLQPDGYAFRVLDATAAPVLAANAAQDIVLNPVTGTILRRFTVPANTRIFLDAMDSTNFVYTPNIRLYDAAGTTRVDSNVGYWPSGIVTTTGAEFYLAIDPSSNETGTNPEVKFTLRLTPDAPVPLAFGGVYSGAVANSYDEYTYTFTLTSPRPILVDVLQNNSALQFELVRDGNQIFSADFDYLDFNTWTFWAPTVRRLDAGNYTVRVRPISPVLNPDFSFRIVDLTTSPVISSTSGNGVGLPDNRMSSSYAVNLPFGARFIAMPGVYAGTNGSTSAQLSVYDPSGNAVSVTRFDSTPFAFTTTAAGTYYVVFAPDSNDTGAPVSGSFSLREGVQTVTPIALNGVNSGAVADPGDITLHRFEVTNSTTVLFDAQSRSTNLVWSLVRLNGSSYNTVVYDTFFANSDADAGEVDPQRLSQGVYEFRVNGFGSGTGDFAFVLHSEAAAAPLEFETSTNIALVPSKATALVGITATNEAWITVDISNLAGLAARPTVRVFSSSGDMVARRQSFEPVDFIRIPSAGSYIVALEGQITDDSVSGSFDLVVHQRPPVAPLIGLKPGVPFSGDVANPLDLVAIDFTVTNVTSVVFDAISGFDFRWSLLCGDQVVVNDRWFSQSDGFDFPTDVSPAITLKPAPYRLLVRGDGAATGAFSFNLLPLTNSTPIEIVSGYGHPVVQLDPGQSTVQLALDLQAGDDVSFSGFVASGFSPAIRVIDPAGILLASGVAGDTFFQAKVSGTYLVLVEGDFYEPNANTQVEWDVDVFPGTDPNLPPSISLGSTISGTLSGVGAEAFYRFDLNKDCPVYLDNLGQNYGVYIFIDGELSNGSTTNVLYDRELIYTDGNNVSPAAMLLPAGRYTVRLVQFNGGDIDYSFRLLGLPTGDPLEFGVETFTTLDPGTKTQAFQFWGTNGHILRFQAVNYNGSQPFWRLISPKGEELWSGYFDTGSYYARLGALPVDGVYTLLVEGPYYGGTYPNDVVFRVDDSGPAVQPITFGTTVTALTTNAGDRQLFSFEVGDQKWIAMDSLTNDYSHQWRIWSRDNFQRITYEREFAYSDSGNSYSVFQLSKGSYLVEVFRVDWASSGNEAAVGFRLLTQGQAAPLVLGANTDVTLTPANASAVFSFPAIAGQRFYFRRPDSPTYNNYPYVRIIGPDGQNISSTSYYNNDFEPYLTGTHYLLFEGSIYETASSSTGSFTLLTPTNQSFTISLGETKTGRLQNDLVAHEFNLDVPVLTRVALDALTNTYARISIRGAGGTILSPRNLRYSDSANGYPVFSLQPGSYTVRIEADYLGSTDLAYSFRLLDLGTAQAIAIDQTVLTTNSPARSTRIFRFTGTAGDIVRPVWDFTSGFQYNTDYYRIYWRLIDPNGNQRAASAISGSFDDVNLYTSGEYTLLVEGNIEDNAAQGINQFAVRRINFLPPVAMALDTIVSGAITNSATAVVYQFTLPQFTRVAFDSLTPDDNMRWTLSQLGGTTFVNNRSFYYSDSAYASYNGNGVQSLPAGTYRLVVRNRGETNGFQFVLRNLSNGLPLAFGAPVTATNIPANASTVYSFNIPTNTSLYIDGITSIYGSYYRLVDPNGNPVVGPNWIGSDQIFNTSVPGDYAFLVEGLVYNQYPEERATFAIYQPVYTSPVGILQQLNRPDLEVSALAVSPSAGIQAGSAVTVQWTLRNNGDAPANSNWTDRVVVRNLDRAETIVDSSLPYVEADAGSGIIAPLGTRSRQLVVNLPAGVRGAGNLQVTVTTDSGNQLIEANVGGSGEANNSTSLNFSSALPALPDLRVIDLVAVPSTGWTPGVPVTLNWSVTNAGSAATPGDWRDAFTVSNSTRGFVIVSGSTNYIAANVGNGSIAPGEKRSRSITFQVPANSDSSGLFVTRVTTDATNAFAEALLGLDGDTNNTAAITNLSAPDIQVASIALVGSPNLVASSNATFIFVYTNSGTGPTIASWYGRLGLTNQTTSQQLIYTDVYFGGNIPPGGSVTNTYSFTLPDGANGAGQLGFGLTADYYNYIAEVNPPINAETNNSLGGSATSTLPAYPDLRITRIVLSNSPAIYAGGNATVHWTVTNAGTATAVSWNDGVIISNNLAAALVNTAFGYGGSLAAGASLDRAAVVSLPAGPASIGTLTVAVTADVYNQIFELLDGINAETNNLLRATATSVGMQFTQHPLGVVTNAGSTVSLVGSVSGGLPPYSYQWLKGGSPISGETNASLVLTNVQVNQTANYSLRAQDQVATLTSSNAVVVILPDEAQLFVTRFEPLGLVTSNVTRFVVEFNRPIQTATFTSNDVAIVGPAGPVNQALISIADAVPADGKTFVVSVPTLSAEGSYTATIGPNITDLSGNPMSSLVQVVNETFASNPSGWTFNGSSAWNAGGFLRLTPNSFGLAGSSFFGTAQTPAPFVVEFDFNMNGGVGLGDSDGPGADGITFIVANQANAGGSGGGIGYAGYPGTSFAVELDSFHLNSGDPDGDHVGIDYNGSLTSIATKVPSRFIDTGVWHATIRYDGSRNLLAIVRSPSNEFSVVSSELPANSIPPQYTFGFAAGTGSGAANHDIDNVVVRLLPAGETNGAYIASFTIDKSGPIITNFTPIEVAGSIQAAQVAFNESILASSFTAADVALTGDGAPAVSGVVALSSNRFQINFASALPAGGYSIAVGPAITDLAGNAMNQNGNGVFGETPGDVFLTSLTVAIPNLVANVSLVPSATLVGTSADVVYAITNIGTGPVTNAWSIGFYLATDAAGSGSVNLLNVSANTNLLAGASIVRTQTVALPAGIFGARFLGVRADVFNQVSELNEADNTDYADAATVIQAADLVADALSAPPTASLGTSITVDWTVRNGGNGAATASWNDRVYLSTNAGSILGARVLDTDASSSPLAAGGTYGRSKSLLIPLDANSVTGAFFIVFSTDISGNQFETNEANNIRSVPISITSPPLPDLVPTLLTIPSVAPLNGSIDVVYAVTNQGGTAATLPWSISVLTATDTNGTGESIRGTFALNTTLSAGAGIVRTQTVTLPPGVFGSRFVGVRADTFNQVIESDETNNVAYAPVPVVIQGADLAVTQITAPPSAILGTTINVSFDVLNGGDAPAPAVWQDRIYLSSASNSLVGARLLDTVASTPPVAAGVPYSRNRSVGIPLDGTSTPGSFFIVVSTDDGNSQTETNEANNLRSVPITLTLPPIPDLAVHSVAAPLQVQAGQPFSITYAVTNVNSGPAVAPWSIQFLIADDASGTGESVLTTVVVNQNLAANGVISGSQSVVLPISATGTRFVGIRIDSANNVAESDETNNRRYTTIGTAVQSADLEVLSLSGPSTAEQGSSISLGWSVKNSGSGPADAPWTDRILLVRDPVTLADAVVLDTVNAPQTLAAGASYPQTKSVTLPVGGSSATGAFHIVIIADSGSVQSEFNEANNRRSAPITITLPALPDLATTNVVLPATVTPGLGFEVVWAVTNIGGAPVKKTWNDRIYLSADDALGSDVLLATVLQTNLLAPGAGLARTQTVTMPLTFSSSTGHVFVVSDALGELVEETILNNTARSASSLTIQSGLTLSLPLTEVREDAANPAMKATVFRVGDISAPLVVSIVSSNTAELTVPASVTIPAGASSAQFNITAVADGVPDGDKDVQIAVFAENIAGDRKQVRVLDVNVPSLKLTLGASSVVEGLTVPVTVSTEIAKATDSTISLYSFNQNQLAVPPEVILPAGATSVVFAALAVDDTLIETNRAYQIRATAGGFNQAESLPLTIIDNDKPALTLAVEPSTFSESAGPQAARATITRSPVTDQAVVLRLASSDPTAATVPLSVTIPANQASVSFYVAAVDDLLVDGPQSATLSAFVTTTIGNNILSGPASTTVTVTDNEGAALSLKLNRTIVAEGLSPATFATISRNTETSTNLTVTLVSSATTEASLPATAVIPAGSSNVIVQVASVEDNVSDGTQTATLTASASGFAPGSDVIQVTDVDKADLAVTDFVTPVNGYTDETLTLSFKVLNQGKRKAAANTIQRIYLSKDATLSDDDTLIGQVPFNGEIGAGQQISLGLTFYMPHTPGTYYFFAKADAGLIVDEIDEDNNVAVSAPVTVLPDYTASVSTPFELGLAGTSVPLSGSATKINGDPASFKPVNVHVVVRGVRRVITVLTDLTGHFTTVFTPLPNEAGNYTVGAAHPGEPVAPTQDQFTLLGMKADPQFFQKSFNALSTFTGEVTLENLADVDLTSVSATISSVSGITASVDITNRIAGLTKAPVRFQITSTVDEDALANLNVRVVTAEGVVLDVPVYLQVKQLRPSLLVSPGNVRVGVVRGSVRTVQLEVVNTGAANSGPLDILLPSVFPWMSIASANPIPNLAPGETNIISLQLSPQADFPIGEYNGNFAVQGTNNLFVSIPFAIKNVSSSVGDLKITTVDESTYYGSNQVNLAGAKVVVRDPFNGEAVAQGNTGPDGTFQMAGIREGIYNLEVSAPKHDTVTGTVEIKPGELTDRVVFLRTQLVTYRWTVEEIEIEDRVKITIESVFETVVPTPVVTVEPSVIDVSTILGNEGQINIKISNKGLIAANNTELTVPEHPDWEFIPLIKTVGVLPAKSSLTIPMTVRKKAGSGASTSGLGLSGKKKTMSSGAPCSLSAGVKWDIVCGPFNIGYNVPMLYVNLSAGCIGLGGSGGGWGGWGGWGGGGFGGGISGYTGTPFYSPPNKCACDSGNFNAKCIEGEAGIQIDVKGKLLDLANKIVAAIPAALNPQLRGFAVKGFVKGQLCDCCENNIRGVKAKGEAGATVEAVIGIGKAVEIGAAALTVEGVADVSGVLKGFAGLELTVALTGSGSIETDCFLKNPKICVNGSGGAKAFLGGKLSAEITGTIEGEGVHAEGEAAFGLEAGVSAQLQDCTGSPATAKACFDGLVLKAEGSVAFVKPNGSKVYRKVGGSIELAGQKCTGDSPAPSSTRSVDPSALLATFGFSSADQAVKALSGTGQSVVQVAPAQSAYVPLLPASVTTPTASGSARKVEFVSLPPRPASEKRAAPSGITTKDAGAVCAQVRLQIEQTASLTRKAIGATLEVDNQSDTATVDDLTVQINIYGPDGSLANDKFVILKPETANLTVLSDGTFDTNGFSRPLWQIAPGQTGRSRWVIIPLDAAAPDVPVLYTVGGVMTYSVAGAPTSVVLAPGPVTVYPNPKLALKYFHQRDVYSDDPFTDEIEPSVPYVLAVMTKNNGKGVAKKFSITSSQPKIIENYKGLLIDFKIIATDVDNMPLTPTLTANFGDMNPGDIKIGRWYLTSTIQGLFVDYSAKFEHEDSLGGRATSPIESVEIHELIHPVFALGARSDGKQDFLVNDVPDERDMPDTVHLSDFTTNSVALIEQATFDGAPSSADLEIQMTVVPTNGFFYVRVPDPADKSLYLVAAVRGDGRSLPVNTNVWRTDRTFIGLGKPPVKENILHLFDDGGPGTYTLYYSAVPPQSDTLAPTSRVAVLPPVSLPQIPVIWSGEDNVPGAGIAYYDVFVSEDGGPFLPWLRNNPRTSAIYDGVLGHRYAFYSVATDNAANREGVPGAPDAETFVGRINHVPSLTVSPAVTVDEGATAFFGNSAADTDPGDVLTFSLGAGSPAGAVIDPLTGNVTWPTSDVNGDKTFNLFVVVSDNGVPSLSATGLVQVIVRDISIPPTISGQPSSRTNAAGSTATFNISVSSLTTANFQWRRNGLELPGQDQAVLVLTGVQRSTDAGLYDVVVRNSGGSVTSSVARLVVNTVPVANDDTLTRQTNKTVRVRLSTLLANDSDPDVDVLSVASVSSTSAKGATVTIDGGWVLYRAAAGMNEPDTFSYTVTDPFGATATATVRVDLGNTSGPTSNLISVTPLPDGRRVVRGLGIPGRALRIQATDSLSEPVTWTEIGSVIIDPTGFFEFTDLDAPAFGTRFYRAIE